jgi:hypothetical protein
LKHGQGFSHRGLRIHALRYKVNTLLTQLVQSQFRVIDEILDEQYADGYGSRGGLGADAVVSSGQCAEPTRGFWFFGSSFYCHLERALAV